jgi:eukaryotic-like serine/threonine-protein kinase
MISVPVSSGDDWSSSSSGDDGGWGPALPPAAPGDMLAPRYEVVAHLRRGRHLDVYDVWSEERRCRCVIKTLRPERAGDLEAADRLREEGSLLRKLSHPHLVRAYEVLTTALTPRPAIVLETLPGHTVAYLIKEHGPLPYGDVALLGIQLCSVLAYLHGKGWVHLDIKPSNVVATGGRAVLLDLSVAQRIGDKDAGGTFDYLSPEQAQGDMVTEASDVWGLGTALFEAVSGEVPFAEAWHKERNPDGGRRYPQLLERAPRVSTRRPGSPEPLAAIIDACLRPDRAARPSLTEVSAELERWAHVDPKRIGSVLVSSA